MRPALLPNSLIAMEIRAITKYPRISSQKALDVAREIQGLTAARALEVLQFTPRKSARLLEKTLRAAVANAHEYNRHHDEKIGVERLVVKEAQVGRGPQLPRWKAAARGRAAPRLRRSSHIRIVLTDASAKKAR